MKIGTLDAKALVIATLKVAVVASVLNAVLAYLGKIVSQPPATFGPYMYSAVVGLTALGAVAAAAGYVVAHYAIRSEHKANRYFVIASLVLLVVSFYPDLAIPWSTDPDQVGWTYGIIANLMLMHVVAAGLVIYYFIRVRRLA